ncbi:FG-GAP repeat domain-containing protein [Gallaecimonas mangrovi]|uniref:FG-GAP repeat domain-containing protein n=1 Tax=Gallaecimonas mangrovi TaxID=2291597 RepID=UPI0012600EED|nr:VCBS repeat-containing protein [Gallaecimonas mangrovi]
MKTALILVSVFCSAPLWAAQWFALALPTQANGDWLQAGPILYLAGQDKGQKQLSAVDTAHWQVRSIALPNNTDRFCAMDDGRLLLFAKDNVYLHQDLQTLLIGQAPSLWRGVVPKYLSKVSWCHGNRLFIPGFSALRVYRIKQNQLVLESEVPVTAFMSLRMGAPYYQEKAIHLVDVNLDKVPDLLVEGDNGLVVYLGQGRGFAKTPIVFAPGLKLTPLAKRTLRLNDGEDFSKLRVRTLEAVTDLNGDGLKDIIISSLHSKGLLDRSQRFEVHFGIKIANGLGYRVAPDTGFESEGVVFELRQQDLNGDGSLDLYTPAVKLGVGKVISALLTGSVSVDLDIRLLAGGKLHALATGIDSDMEVSLSSGEFRVPLMAAFKLDGSHFIAVKKDQNHLALYRLIADKLKHQQTLSIPLPVDGSRWQQGPNWLAILPGPQDKQQNQLYVVAKQRPALKPLP